MRLSLNKPIEHTKKMRALYLLLFVFAALFLAKSIMKHHFMGTAAYDFGVTAQTVFLLQDSGPAFNTVRGIHSLGDHFQPVAFLTALLYKLFPSFLILFLIQVLAIAAAGWILYRITERTFPGRPALALTFTAAFLANPVVHNPLLWDYHPIVFAMPLLFACLSAYMREDIRQFWIILLLILLVREDTPAVTAGFGVLFLLRGRPAQGLLVIAVSAAWWFLVTKFFMPYFNGEGYFRTQDGTPSVIFRHLFDPAYYYQRFVEATDAWRYLGYLFLPLLLLPLRAPFWLIPALPTLFVVLLLGGYQTNIHYHYSVYTVPFLFIAALKGMESLENNRPYLHPILLSAMLIATLICASHGSRLQPQTLGHDFHLLEERKDTLARLQQLNRQAGPEAGISAGDFFVAHLLGRREIFLFPNPWKIHYWGMRGENPRHPNEVDYIAVNPDVMKNHYPLLRYLQDKAFFKTIYFEDDLWILKRIRQEFASRARAVDAALNYNRVHIDGIQWGQALLSPAFPSAHPSFHPDDTAPPVNWQELSAMPMAQLQLDLADENHIEKPAGKFIYLPVTAAKAQTLTMHTGSDDTLRVWLNGTSVFQSVEPRVARQRDDTITMDLRPGLNHVYFRVDDIGGAWRFLLEIQNGPGRSEDHGRGIPPVSVP